MTLDEAKKELAEAGAAVEVLEAAAAEQQATRTAQLAEKFAGCNDARSTLNALKEAALELSLRLAAVEAVLDKVVVKDAAANSASEPPTPVESPSPEVSEEPLPPS